MTPEKYSDLVQRQMVISLVKVVKSNNYVGNKLANKLHGYMR